MVEATIYCRHGVSISTESAALDLYIIFDLGSCLCAANEAGPQLYDPAFDAIRSANRGALPEEPLSRAFEECCRIPFDDVARRFGLTVAMSGAGM